MKKYILIILFLLLSIYYGYKYLNDLNINKNPFVFEIQEKPFIYQKKDIVLNNIDEFIFDDYFEILSFLDESYTYEFDDNNIKIKLKSINNEFIYPYELIKPKIVEKTVYKTNTEYIYVEADNTLYEDYDYDETYLIQDYFSFPIGTDISSIINEVGSNAIESSESITCDYSKLNPNSQGEYSIYLYADNKTFEIIIEIY